MGFLTSLAIGIGAIIIVGWLSKATKAGLGLGELAGGIRGIIEQPLMGFGTGISAALSPRIAPELAPVFAPEWAPVGFEWFGDVSRWLFPSLRTEDRNNGNGGIIPPSNGGGAGARNGVLPGGIPISRTEDRKVTQFTAGKKALAEATAPRTEDRYTSGLKVYKA